MQNASSIAAFTMGIPSVILSWNDKVEKLMAIIGYEERAIKFVDFDAEYVVERFETALREGVQKKNRCYESESKRKCG